MSSSQASSSLASSATYSQIGAHRDAATDSFPARSRERVDPLLRLVAWSTMLIGSALPVIISRLSGQGSPASIPVLQTLVMVIIALVLYHSKTLRPLMGFILSVAILRLGWYAIAPMLADWAPIQNFSAHSSWAAQQFIARVLNGVGAVLMLTTFIDKNFSRRDLFLRLGQLDAPAEPEPILWIRKPTPWTRLGPQLLFVFGIVLPVFLFITLRPAFGQISRLLGILPWALATAAVNAFNEEFQFRCVPLAHLRGVLPLRESLLLTSVFFGLAHYFGQPSGPIGVVMAGIAGWIWAKSMVETRGAGWAIGIHWVQDVVIFCFLALVAKA